MRNTALYLLTLPLILTLAGSAEVRAQFYLIGDYDHNLVLDIDDIDILTLVVSGTVTPDKSDSNIYDLDGNGVLDLADVQVWLELLSYYRADQCPIPGGCGPTPTKLGDGDLDDDVDGVDFLIWYDNRFETTGLWSQGDYNADGMTDGLDFIIWNENRD